MLIIASALRIRAGPRTYIAFFLFVQKYMIHMKNACNLTPYHRSTVKVPFHLPNFEFLQYILF